MSLPFETVAVVGLGLIGGSLARDLSASGMRILGHDRDRGAVREAVREGVVRAGIGAELDGIEAADAVVLALPVSAAAETLARIAGRVPGAQLVMDTGSTKRAAVEAAFGAGLGPRFVGAHPLAGDQRSGWSASRPGLFDGARVYLCRTAETTRESTRLARVLWAALGGRPVEIDAAAHDALLARTSHLPQVLSTTLARTLAAAGIDPSDVGPGGRDMLRLAGSSPAMWTDILLENVDAIGAALTGMEARLAEMREALGRQDAAAIRRMLEEGGRWGG